MFGNLKRLSRPFSHLHIQSRIPCIAVDSSAYTNYLGGLHRQNLIGLAEAYID